MVELSYEEVRRREVQRGLMWDPALPYPPVDVGRPLSSECLFSLERAEVLLGRKRPELAGRVRRLRELAGAGRVLSDGDREELKLVPSSQLGDTARRYLLVAKLDLMNYGEAPLRARLVGELELIVRECEVLHALLDPVAGSLAFGRVDVLAQHQHLGSGVSPWEFPTLPAGAIGSGILSVLYGGTGASAFLAGGIIYSDGTILTQDNLNLFWDETNKRLRLGAGTALSLYEAGSNYERITAASSDHHVLLLEGKFGGSFPDAITMETLDNAGNNSVALRIATGGAPGNNIVEIVDNDLTVDKTLHVTGSIIATGHFTQYNGIATTGIAVPAIYGVANHVGSTTVDATPTTVYTTTGAGQIYRFSGRILATTLGTGGAATYTLKWTEGGAVITKTLTISAVDVDADFSAIIQPDNATAITAQLTAISGTGTTVNNAAIVEQLA